MTTGLWTEQYRPSTIDGYVFVDEHQIEIVATWIANQSIPNLILSGSPGVGKTTLAKILFKELNVQRGDILEINASAERGIDTVREKITRFAQTMPWGDFKYILLDEADMLTFQAQMPLKNLMEEYHEFTRFILTCNRPEKIDSALMSRCESFHIVQTDKESFINRAKFVLSQEEITYDNDIFMTYVDATYPDLRSCIKNLQTNSIMGTLKTPSMAGGDSDHIIQAVALFKERKYPEARKIITANTRPGDFDRVYRLLYENMDWWSDDAETQKRLLLIIAEGVRWNKMVGDQEINLAATLVNLELEVM